jgi:hypothetical protein
MGDDGYASVFAVRNRACERLLALRVSLKVSGRQTDEQDKAAGLSLRAPPLAGARVRPQLLVLTKHILGLGAGCCVWASVWLWWTPSVTLRAAAGGTSVRKAYRLPE